MGWSRERKRLSKKLEKAKKRNMHLIALRDQGGRNALRAAEEQRKVQRKVAALGEAIREMDAARYEQLRRDV